MKTVIFAVVAAGFWFGGIFGGIVVALLLAAVAILYHISEQIAKSNY